MNRLVLIAGLVLSLIGVARAQEPDVEDSPWTYRLNVGGSFVGGNLYQIQMSGSGRLTYDKEGVRNEVIANGFRLWMRRGDDVILAGDDVTLGNLFTFRAGRGFGAMGFTYLTWSQLHRIDIIAGVGAGPMVELFDGKVQSLRIALLGFAERTTWPGTDFNRAIAHTDGVRTVPRISLLSTSHLALADTPASLQSMGYLHVNPLDVGDIRGVFRASIDVRIVGGLKIGLSGQVAGTSVVLEGVRPVDTRMTVGLTLTPPPQTARSRNTSTNR